MPLRRDPPKVTKAQLKKFTKSKPPAPIQLNASTIINTVEAVLAIEAATVETPTPKTRNLTADGRALMIPLEIRKSYAAYHRLIVAYNQICDVIQLFPDAPGVDVAGLEAAKLALAKATDGLFFKLAFDREFTIDRDKRSPEFLKGDNHREPE